MIVGLVLVHHPELPAGPFLHRRKAGLEVLDLGGEAFITLPELGILLPLPFGGLLQMVNAGKAVFAHPELELDGSEQQHQNKSQQSHVI